MTKMEYNLQNTSFQPAACSPRTDTSYYNPEDYNPSGPDQIISTLSLTEVTDTKPPNADGGKNETYKDSEDVAESWAFTGSQTPQWEVPDTTEGLKEWLIPGEELKDEIVTIKGGKRAKWKAGKWVEESLEQRRKEQKKRRDALKRHKLMKRHDLKRDRKPLPSEKW